MYYYIILYEFEITNLKTQQIFCEINCNNREMLFEFWHKSKRINYYLIILKFDLSLSIELRIIIVYYLSFNEQDLSWI